MYTEPLVPEPSAFEDELAIAKLKKKQVALIMLIIAFQFDVSTSFNMK